MMPTITHHGFITGWKVLHPSYGQIDLLCSEGTTSEGKLRGGAPVCAPSFDSPPSTGAREGVVLKRHGMFRDLKVQRLHGSYPEEAPYNRRYWHSFPARDEEGGNRYPWSHRVEVAVGTSEGNTLHHEVHVVRDAHCVNKRPMPVSIGFHPYFATYGERLRVWVDGEMVWCTGDPCNPSFYVRGRRAEITTIAGTIVVDLEKSYDGFQLWSDNPGAWFCVEPVFGTQADAVLAPGESVRVRCTVSFTSTRKAD